MRIALATVGTTGDIRPFVTLGRALQDAGHDVTTVTWPVHVAAFREAGLPAESAGTLADPAAITRVAEAAADRPPMDQVAMLRDLHLQGGVEHLRDLERLLPGHDLVVLHSIHTLAQAVALDRGLPWASAVFDPVLQPTASAPPPGMPGMGPANRLAWAMLDRMLRRLDGPLDTLLAGAGIRQRGLRMFRARSPRLHLIACSPSIVAVPPDLPATTHVTGAWLDGGAVSPLPDDLESFLGAGPPPVVVTFGSMGASLRGPTEVAIERVMADGQRVVLQGWEPASRDARLMAIGPVDHRALFRRAAVVVHHGGAGTTHAACAAGVPSVVVPHVGDQRYWADRLAKLGVSGGTIPAAHLHAGSLADAVTAARTGARVTAAESLAARLAQEEGVSRSLALLGAA
jgi:UDP:flavonoid glycosyltransferase YjiC (YdhE family)